MPEDPERRWRRRLRCAKCRIAPEPEDHWVGVRSWHTQVTLTEAEPFERGIVDAAATRDDLEDRVFAFVAEHGPVAKRAVRNRVTGRNPEIDAALARHEEAGTLRRTPKGWEACPDPSGTPGHASARSLGGGVPQRGDTPVGGPARGTPRDPAPGSVPGTVPNGGGGEQ